MIKAIANPPAPDRRYLKRMAYSGDRGVNVINGVAPTGRLPKAVGSGVFGVEGQDNGIFDGPAFPKSKTGIFYNDYAKDTTETAQGDLQWQLLRRPGRPLYPGSSARGIVLIGPSMGDNGDGGGAQQTNTSGKLLMGAAAIGAAWLFFWMIKKSAEEG